MSWTILCLLFISIANIRAVEIEKQGAAYNNIYVAIHNSIPENPLLIEGIKKMFTHGSAYLFNATNRRAYYSSVTIVIPISWSKTAVDNTVLTDYYDESHIRIAEANPQFGDSPYTLQPGQCGEQGLYTHFTPRFILNEHDWTTEIYGEPGRQLVHEWAHLRYGVFDEYGIEGSSRYPMFYQLDGKFYPTTCVKGVKGWKERADGQPCEIYRNALSKDCRFIPDLTFDQKRASIMYMPYLPEMETFCDNTTPQKEHDRRSPSMQNDLCDYKSTWEVISSNKDFLGAKGEPSQSVDVGKTKPSFQILRRTEEKQRTVLVMDISSSMNSNNRLVNLQRAAHSLIMDIMPENSWLGLVQFSSTATQVAPMTQITSQATRVNLASKIPPRAGGSTAIGLGLLKAIEVLRGTTGQSTAGARIILISDGGENIVPHVAAVKKQVMDSKVIVNSIAQGPAAANSLQEITVATGGKFFFVDDSTNVANTDLQAAFYESVTVQGNVEVQPVTISDTKISLMPNLETRRNFFIDKELGKNTVIEIGGSTSIGVVEIQLISPSRTIYNKQSKEFSDATKLLSRKRFVFPNAEHGGWTMVIKSSTNTQVTFKMTSEALDPKEQPIRTRSWFGDIIVQYPAQVKVFAQVAKGPNAVIGATVKAFIQTPLKNVKELNLRDNGIGADVLKDDGIYTSYFAQFEGNGRYSTVVEVKNDGKARIRVGVAGSAAPSKIKRQSKNDDPPQEEFVLEDFVEALKPPEEKEVPSEPAQDFERNVNVGAFNLEGLGPGVEDLVAPNRITDFLAEASSYDVDSEINVTLSWTAPGDDLDFGTASAYEILSSNDSETLINPVGTSSNYRFDQLNVIPLISGSLQRVEFVLPDKLLGSKSSAIDVFFSIRARDNAKTPNWSPGSNIASLHFGYNAPPQPTIPPTPEDTTWTETETQSEIEDTTEPLAQEFTTGPPTPEETSWTKSQSELTFEPRTGDTLFSTTPGPGNTKKDTSSLVGIIVGGAVGALVLIVGVCLVVKCAKKKKPKDSAVQLNIIVKG